MPLLEARSQLAAKVESVEGTAETLAAADAVLAGDIKFDPDFENDELDLQSSSLSPSASTPGGRKGKLTFKTELKGSGTAGTAPEIGKLIRACGFGETIVAGTSVTYAPASASIPSLTMAHYLDGKRYLMAGARGNFNITLKAGKAAIISFDFQGASLDDSDTALLTSISYQATRAKAFQNAAFTIDTYAAIIESLIIASGNTIEMRDSANAAYAYLSAVITKRLMTAKFNPEDVLVATKDFWATWEAGTLVALSTVIGATAGNILTITAPKVQYMTIGQGSRKGYAMKDFDAALRRNAGDDEISIAFT